MTIVSGSALSTLRLMENFAGKTIEGALPGTPATVFGWDEMPKPGTHFTSFTSKNDAEKYREEQAVKALGKKSLPVKETTEEERVILPLVIKADVLGSLDALQYEIGKLATPKIIPKIIHAGTGPINESDIKSASAKSASIVLGFYVTVDTPAKNSSLRDGVSIELFDIIYKLVERVQTILSERTPKIETAETRGKAKIIRLFSVVKDKQIIGGKVIEGKIGLGDEFKIIRRTAEVAQGQLRGLEQAKVKTKEVAEGYEFGALVEARIEIARGDTIETFVIVKK